MTSWPKQIDAATSTSDKARAADLRQERESIANQIGELRQRLDDRDRDLEKALLTLEERRTAEAKRLYSRLDELSHAMQYKRDAALVAPSHEEAQPQLHATYAELSQRPSFYTKLHLAVIGKPMVYPVFLVFLIPIALLAFLVSDYVNRLQRPASLSPDELLLLVIINALPYFILLTGALIVWFRITQLDRYFDYAKRILRTLYIQEAKATYLLEADSILRNALEQFGPTAGRKRANETLRHMYPMLFEYLSQR